MEGEKLVVEKLNIGQRIYGYKITVNIQRIQAKFPASRLVRPGTVAQKKKLVSGDS